MKRACLLAFCLLSASFALPAQTSAGTLRVRVECAKSGTLHLIVVDQARFGAPDENEANAVVPIRGRTDGAPAAELEFPDIRRGTYGVKAFLDMNGNGKLDVGAFGMPNEPWGMSWKTKKPTLRPPRFSDIAFEFAGDRDVRVVVE